MSQTKTLTIKIMLVQERQTEKKFNETNWAPLSPKRYWFQLGLVGMRTLGLGFRV